jgi:hypothetical protein
MSADSQGEIIGGNHLQRECPDFVGGVYLYPYSVTFW